jgi:hypothetical protein
MLCCVIFSSCALNEKTIDPGENIHHDDFEYSVQHLDRTGEIGNLRTSGTFLIVTFQVENRAKRVNHRWSNDVAYIVDTAGVEYDNNTEAQKELDRIKPFGYKPEYVTPAGNTETTILVFDLPKSVSQPYLKVHGSLMMGDVFDLNEYTRTRVKLF